MFDGSSRGGFLSRIPPVTKNLLILNVGLWLACSIFSGFGDFVYAHLGLRYWGGDSFNPMQLLTYMFLQEPLGGPSGFSHIFFNMFALYMFGRILEMTWGARRFLMFYVVCGMGAGLVQEIVWWLAMTPDFISALAVQNGLPEGVVREQLAADPALAHSLMSQYTSALLTIGASGAVFALLLGFGCVYPNIPMYFFFIPVPIKAKYMVGAYAVLEFFFGITGMQGNVAHFAHLGGMLFAVGFILWWRARGTLHQRDGM